MEDTQHYCVYVNQFVNSHHQICANTILDCTAFKCPQLREYWISTIS